eukprot:2317528-Amphidinium_carterae.1
MAKSEMDASLWFPVIQPLVRNHLMYLLKSQFKAVRQLLQESRNKLDGVFYYGRCEGVLDITLEADAVHQMKDSFNVSQPLGDQVEEQDQDVYPDASPELNQVMIGAAGKGLEEPYVDLFLENPPGIADVLLSSRRSFRS